MGRFRFLTSGESHGKGLVAIVEGMVADLSLEEGHINRELKRRQQGYGRGPRMKIEEDRAEIISGVRYGLTTGSPISLFIANRDWENWQQQMSVSAVEEQTEPVTRPRPGHADLAGIAKYGLRDIRPIIERASARETAARVAVGAVARRFLEEFGIVVHSHTVSIGHVSCRSTASYHPGSSCHAERSEESQRPFTSFGATDESRHPQGEKRPKEPAQDQRPDESAVDWRRVEASPVRCADVEMEEAMMAVIDEAKAAGDTLGGVVEVIAMGVPVGLGSHVSWDRRLDGRVAQALMSINAVKAVEIGSGSALASCRGSEAHDVIVPAYGVEASEPCAFPMGGGPTGHSLPWRHATNYAGGIEGGMSNGESIVIRAAVKPVATLAGALPSIDLRSGETTEAHYERSDVCVVPAVGVIAEAMLCITLADGCLEKFGGDNLEETLANYEDYLMSVCEEWDRPGK